MMSRSMTAMGVLSLTVLLATGCDNAKDMQIGELQRQLDAVEQQNADLENQLGLAMRDGEEARRRALQLQQLLDQCRNELASARSQPMQPTGEAPPAGWTKLSEQVSVIELGSDILFDSGRATLKKAGQDRISQIANDIRSQYSDRQIWVIGHTDTDPIKKSDWDDNLELSLNRGASVAREMFKQGINPERTIVAGQGEHNPKGSQKALNRRVEIYAVDASMLPA